MTQNLNHYEKILSRSHSNYLAQISIEMTDANNQINDVLSKLTALGTVLIPMNLVTGLWGMNVHVPGQDVPVSVEYSVKLNVADDLVVGLYMVRVYHCCAGGIRGYCRVVHLQVNGWTVALRRIHTRIHYTVVLETYYSIDFQHTVLTQKRRGVEAENVCMVQSSGQSSTNTAKQQQEIHYVTTKKMCPRKDRKTARRCDGDDQFKAPRSTSRRPRRRLRRSYREPVEGPGPHL